MLHRLCIYSCTFYIIYYILEVHTHAVQEGSSLTLPCSSAENRAFQTRAWYRGFQLPDQVLPDPDMVLYSQTANRLIPDPDPGAIEVRSGNYLQ